MLVSFHSLPLGPEKPPQPDGCAPALPSHALEVPGRRTPVKDVTIREHDHN
jgi:hypothetical protein